MGQYLAGKAIWNGRGVAQNKKAGLALMAKAAEEVLEGGRHRHLELRAQPVLQRGAQRLERARGHAARIDMMINEAANIELRQAARKPVARVEILLEKLLAGPSSHRRDRITK